MRRATRLRLLGICAAALCAGCSFKVPGIDLPAIGLGDLGGGDATAGDLARGPFVPSNVSPTHVQEGASSLSGPRDIDTEKLLIDGQPPPVGIVFMPELTHDQWAVLSVRDLTIDGDLKVHGRRSLVVVAVGDVRLTAMIHAEAAHRAPGPGGQFTGQGKGGDGKSNGNDDSGGGGGGYGAPGAAGGPSQAPVDGEGGLGGPAYPVTLVGGSAGGDGAGASGAMPCPTGAGYSLGGAGGGVVQLSAEGIIDVQATGGVHAGGGGGRGGCLDAASAGGGGGSGGVIWLEAPMMRILGVLAANGGGGGSGGRAGLFVAEDGKDGDDGKPSTQPAGGSDSQGNDSGAGGAGGVINIDAKPGAKETNGGGGGGAVGHVRLRTRGVAPVTDPGTIMSPGPELTVDF